MSHDAHERGKIGAAVLTISTSRARAEGADEGGAALVAFAERLGARVIGTEVIADEQGLIEARLRWWCDEGGCELLLTTGGTGFSPDDLTPEATRAVIEREAPGVAEAMRSASREHTALWMVSRGVVGTRGRTLVINFPGNPPAIEQAGAGIAAAIPHALALLTGRRPH